MNCVDARKLFSLHYDRRPEAADVQTHLDACHGCRHAWESYRADLGSLDRAQPVLQPKIPEFTRLVIVSGPSAIRIGAVAGAAAAALVAITFHLLGGASEDPPSRALLRQELAEHLRQADGLFRQILYCSAADPRRELELLSSELVETGLGVQTRKLKRAFGDGDEGTYLQTCDLALRELESELRGGNDPSTKLARIRTLLTESRLLDSIGIVSIRLAGDAAPSESDEAALFAAGRRAYLLGRYESAFQHLDSLLERFPQTSYRVDAIYWMGNCAEHLGRADLAGELYNYIPDAPWFEKRMW
jgi:tetratricopeptide (TPR) repeat protein